MNCNNFINIVMFKFQKIFTAFDKKDPYFNINKTIFFFYYINFIKNFITYI